eukprot:gnl/MRDRNA2_/MRDRNA2_70305_c0_seq1.p1 gnl/MRDRNA2_/MRDRNA2_70305_c0~~gnl/MRDRNA2_/MRDRNA2_70305_c0_seq1.p1  ORF type:complete len:374 (+),score=48.07 gnl/MRDRNA2_/MRDRNA2_70305_c0_seq1:81-1202(+)
MPGINAEDEDDEEPEKPPEEEDNSSVEELPEGTACQTPETWATMYLPVGRFCDFQWQFVACPNVSMTPKDEVEHAILVARNMHLSDCGMELGNVNAAPEGILGSQAQTFPGFEGLKKRDKFYQSPYAWPKSCGPKWRLEPTAESTPVMISPVKSSLRVDHAVSEDDTDDVNLQPPSVSAERVCLELPTSYRGRSLNAMDPPPTPMTNVSKCDVSVMSAAMHEPSVAPSVGAAKTSKTLDPEAVTESATVVVPPTPREVTLNLDAPPIINGGSQRRTRSATGTSRKPVRRLKAASPNPSLMAGASSDEEVPLQGTAVAKTPKRCTTPTNSAPKRSPYTWSSQRSGVQPLPQGTLGQCLSSRRHGNRVGSPVPQP